MCCLQARSGTRGRGDAALNAKKGDVLLESIEKVRFCSCSKPNVFLLYDVV